jgi:hypothetical protein
MDDIILKQPVLLIPTTEYYFVLKDGNGLYYYFTEDGLLDGTGYDCINHCENLN